MFLFGFINMFTPDINIDLFLWLWYSRRELEANQT